MAWAALRHSLMITTFVAMMMLAVEYVNVQTRGVALRALRGARWRQYLIAGLLGATPGCLGAFVLVTLYSHRHVTLGALTAGMIATSGDEMFVMLTLFPGTAALMTAGLVVLGMAAAWFVDRVVWPDRRRSPSRSDDFKVHALDDCRCFRREQILAQWRPPSPHRAILAVAFALIAAAVTAGELGPPVWGWSRITLLALSALGAFIVITVPDHFLDQHLWEHVAARHVPRIFLWTFGALAALAVLDAAVDLGQLVSSHPWPMLAIAALIGLVPESGPHLLFVTLYAGGDAGLSALVTSSAVQDGHGMLPLLAHSRGDFLRVKAINLLFGLAAGAVLLGLGS